jgi:hypothetical protein
MIPAAFFGPEDRRHSFVQLTVLPLIAGCALVLPILAEGHGLAPLIEGLTAHQAYPPSGTIRENIAYVASLVGNGALLIVGMAVAVWSVGLALRAAAPFRVRPMFHLASFCFVAAMASLAQFYARHYGHYALLTIAAAVPAAALIGEGVVNLYLNVERRRLLANDARAAALLSFVVIVAAMPMVRPARNIEGPYIFPAQGNLPVTTRLVPLRYLSGVAEDLRIASALFVHGENVLVLPPSRNEIHLALGTRSRSFSGSYGWDEGDGAATKAVFSPSLAGVFVLRRHLSQTDLSSWDKVGAAEAVARLPEAGFTPVASLQTMDIWRRQSSRR